MAIPNNYIDKITNKDTGESRIISPAADMVRVRNENFEGADLDEVLDEVAQAIEDAGSGDGTVTGVKMNNGQPIPPDQNGVVDLGTVITDVSNKVDKVTGYGLSKNDYTDADKTKLAGIEPGAEVNVINGIKANGASETLPVDQNGIVTLPPASAGGLTEEDISVSSNQDGTFDINVGEDTYTINLNHTHPGMVKLEKVTEATLPDPEDMEDDTIYVQVDSLTTSTEIEALYIFGLEFTGGGLPAGTPQITMPKANTVINLGTLSGQSGATGTVRIKGKSLTANSTVVVSVGSGFSLSYGQQSGSSITISAADAIVGADVDVFATAYGTTGTLLITSQTDNINHAVDLTSDVYEELTAVKLTGTQWLQTDYRPNELTEFTMECKFSENSLTRDYPNNNRGDILHCDNNAGDGKKFRLYTGSNTENYLVGAFLLSFINESSLINGSTYQQLNFNDNTIPAQQTQFCTDNTFIAYTIGQSNGTISFRNSATSQSVNTSKKTSEMDNYLKIGATGSTPTPLQTFDLTIYSLVFSENGSPVRNYVPRKRNGVTGLYDTVNGGFLSSETAKTSGLASDELVAIPLT